MSNTVRIKLYVDTGFANCKHEDEEEIDRGVWEAMSEEERAACLEDAAQTYLSNCIDFGAYVEE